MNVCYTLTQRPSFIIIRHSIARAMGSVGKQFENEIKYIKNSLFNFKIIYLICI